MHLNETHGYVKRWRHSRLITLIVMTCSLMCVLTWARSYGHMVADKAAACSAGCRCRSRGTRGSRLSDHTHLIISFSRSSSCFCLIMTLSMIARSSGVRWDKSGMSAMSHCAFDLRLKCAYEYKARTFLPVHRITILQALTRQGTWTTGTQHRNSINSGSFTTSNVASTNKNKTTK